MSYWSDAFRQWSSNNPKEYNEWLHQDSADRWDFARKVRSGEMPWFPEYVCKLVHPADMRQLKRYDLGEYLPGLGTVVTLHFDDFPRDDYSHKRVIPLPELVGVPVSSADTWELHEWLNKRR